MEPKFLACCALKSTKLRHIRLANTVELHLTLNTVLVPVVDQVKLALGSWLLMSWGTFESRWFDMSDLITST